MLYAQLAVLGLGLGAIYVALGTSLMLVHRATGIINFAQGAIGMWGTYVFAQLMIDGRLVFPVGEYQLAEPPSVWTALAIGLITALVLGALIHVLVFRPVRRA